MENEKISMIDFVDFLNENFYHRFIFDTCNQKSSNMNARFVFNNVKIDYNPNRIIFLSNMTENYLRLEFIKSISVCKQTIGDVITIVCRDFYNNGEDMEYIIIAQ